MPEDKNHDKSRSEIESELRAKAEELAAAFSDFAQDLSRDLSRKAEDFSKVFAGMAQDFRERAAADAGEASTESHETGDKGTTDEQWRQVVENRLSALEAAVGELRGEATAS